MLQATIIGRLGADAEVKNADGHKFVSFRVAHSESFTTANGEKRERTQWVSCALNGEATNLVPYLKTGTQVCVVGNMTLGVASSQRLKCMVATCNIHVRSIELLGGGSNDEVPKQLADETGQLLDVIKFYSVSAEDWKKLKVGKAGKQLYDTRGNSYTIDKQALITRNQAPSAEQNEQQPNSNDNGEQPKN